MQQRKKLLDNVMSNFTAINLKISMKYLNY